MDDLLTIGQAAKEAVVSETYIRQLCQKGKLDAFKLGHIWVIPRNIFESWNDSRQPPGRPRKSFTEEE
jgi:excisionase family DNA binding protein